MKSFWKLSEISATVMLVTVLAGLAGLAWVLAISPQTTTLTAQATRPVRATRQALTQTAVVQSTRSIRQTRRAQTAIADTSYAAATEEPVSLSTEKDPTPTRDPLTPMPDAGTPEPTGIVFAETVTPYPSPTFLPSIPSEKRIGFWTENLEFGSTQPLVPNLASTIPSFKEILGGLSVSRDGMRIAIGVWTGETTDWKGKQDPNVQIGPIPLFELYLVDLDSGSVTFLCKGYNAIWSPTGEYLAYTPSNEDTNERGIEIINSKTKQIWQVTILDEQDPYTDYAWLSPTELLYYKDTPQVFDLSTENTLPLFEGNSEQFRSEFPPTLITTAPDSGIFAIGSVKEIFFFRRENGTTNLIRKLEEGVNNRYWSLSPNGDVLAFSTSSRGQLRLENVYGDINAIELPEGNGPAIVDDWSADSISVIYHDRDGARIVNRDGSGLGLLPEIETMIGPVWAEAGAKIIWIDRAGQLLSKAASQK